MGFDDDVDDPLVAVDSLDGDDVLMMSASECKNVSVEAFLLVL